MEKKKKWSCLLVNRRHAAEGCGGGSWPLPIPHGSSPQAAVILCSSPPPSVVFCVRVFPVELTLYIDAPLIQTYKHSSAALLPPQEDAWRSPVDVQSLRSFTGWESFCGTHLEFLCLSFIYFCGCFLGFFFQFFFFFFFLQDFIFVDNEGGFWRESNGAVAVHVRRFGNLAGGNEHQGHRKEYFCCI